MSDTVQGELQAQAEGQEAEVQEREDRYELKVEEGWGKSKWQVSERLISHPSDSPFVVQSKQACLDWIWLQRDWLMWSHADAKQMKMTSGRKFGHICYFSSFLWQLQWT